MRCHRNISGITRLIPYFFDLKRYRSSPVYNRIYRYRVPVRFLLRIIRTPCNGEILHKATVEVILSYIVAGGTRYAFTWLEIGRRGIIVTRTGTRFVARDVVVDNDGTGQGRVTRVGYFVLVIDCIPH